MMNKVQINREQWPRKGIIKDISHLNLECLGCGKERAIQVVEIIVCLWPGEPERGFYRIFPHVCEVCGGLEPGKLVEKLLDNRGKKDERDG